MFYLQILFIAAIGIQAGYFLVFIIGFLKKQSTATKIVESQPISIVLCAHDELENLKVIVPQLLAQEYTAFELIVVNDRSNDETFDWLLEETKKDSRLRTVQVDHTPEHINGKKYALTLGIRAAQHEWIALIDADCRPASTQWLNSLQKQFSSDAQFVLAFSPYLKDTGWLNRFIRFDALITALQYLGFALVKSPYMGVGRNMAYRKSLFMESKGFNHMLSLTGGDDDLFVNMHATGKNTAVALGKESLVYSLPKTSVSEFYQQKIRHLAAGKKYKFKHRLMLGMFMLTWVLTWFIGIPLLFTTAALPLAGALLLTRLLFFVLSLHLFQKKTGDTFELWALPLLDIFYVIYYLTTGTAAFFTKKIKWKN